MFVVEGINSVTMLAFIVSLQDFEDNKVDLGVASMRCQSFKKLCQITGQVLTFLRIVSAVKLNN